MDVADCGVVANSGSYEAKRVSFAKGFTLERADPIPDLPIPTRTHSDSQSETYPNSQDDYRTSSAYAQVDSQRENFLQEYVTEGEEDEEKKDDKLVDYLLEALKGEEKELRMEGNSYMDDEERKKFLMNHCPELFADLASDS